MKGKTENEVLKKGLCLAILMLIDTKAPIRTIAQVCGFSSIYKMSKQFTEAFERTPTQVRKMFKVLPYGWGDAYGNQVLYELGKITYFDSIYLGPGRPYTVEGAESKKLIEMLVESNPGCDERAKSQVMIISSDTGREEGRAIVVPKTSSVFVGEVRIKYDPLTLIV